MNNKLYKYISGKWTLLLAGFIFLTGCNQEWEGEQYEKYISFVHTGVKKIYLKYEKAGGKKTYKIPVQVSGSEIPKHEINVTVALDKDTIAAYNFETYRYREDLYYKELDEKHYELQSWSTTIPGGDIKGYLYIDFTLEGLDMYDHYFLPLQIDSSSDLPPNPRKHYKKTLLDIVLFNDFSGKYSVAGDLKYQTGQIDSNGNPITETQSLDDRMTWVVNENTIFFYAGMISEDALDRRNYIVYARFEYRDDTSGTITLWCNNPDIQFESEVGSFSIAETMDKDKPYQKRIYTTIDLEYSYLDMTNPSFPLKYEYAGPMVMDRVYNTLMPEEDQIVWE